MKKLIFYLMAMCLSLTFLPMQSIAQKNESEPTLTTVKSIEQVEVKSRNSISNERIDLDKSNKKLLNKKNAQQVELQVEGRRHNHGGVYISVGGILLIILLVILFT